MSLFDRIRRITRANMHWLLDQIEPAEQELESRIKELEETIQQGRESAATYGATFRRMERELEMLAQRQAALTAEAEQALKAGDETFARGRLAEKIGLQERIGQIAPGIEQGRKTYEQLRSNLLRLQEQLKAARIKLQDLKVRKMSAEAQRAFDQQLGRMGSTGGEGAAFERLEEEVLQREAEAQVRREMLGDSLDAALEQRSRELQVEAELQNLKDRIEN